MADWHIWKQIRSSCVTHQKKCTTYYLVLPNNYVGNLVAIHTSITFECIKESDITYLEPPRPLRKEGHTKEEMDEAWSTGWDNQLKLQSVGSFETFEYWYFNKFPTATAPTEEVTEEDYGTIELKKLVEKVKRMTKEEYLELYGEPSAPQPQPSFTREEMLLLWEAFDSYFTTEVYHDLRAKLRPPISRLDLLIKWWGEQERPSELQFQTFDNGTAPFIEAFGYKPLESSTHYRRGTSEWISLEGVV